MKRPVRLMASLVAALLCTPLAATAQAPVDRWTFSLQPYAWLPSFDGEFRYGPPPPGGSSANVSVDSGGVFEALNFALMLQGEARKGPWSIVGDFIYLDFGSEKSDIRSVDFNPGPGPINIATTQLNAGTQTSLDGVVFTLAGGYSVVNHPGATVDLIAGFRYADIKVHTNWNLTAAVTGPAGAATFAREGSVERSTDFFDGIVGARGRLRVGDGQWFVPFHVDVGAGSSDLTWQALVGLGYTFSWGDLTLAYRYLYYDEGNDNFIQELSFGGFAIGANFRF